MSLFATKSLFTLQNYFQILNVLFRISHYVQLDLLIISLILSENGSTTIACCNYYSRLGMISTVYGSIQTAFLTLRFVFYNNYLSFCLFLVDLTEVLWIVLSLHHIGIVSIVVVCLLICWRLTQSLNFSSAKVIVIYAKFIELGESLMLFSTKCFSNFSKMKLIECIYCWVNGRALAALFSLLVGPSLFVIVIVLPWFLEIWLCICYNVDIINCHVASYNLFLNKGIYLNALLHWILVSSNCRYVVTTRFDFPALMSLL
jgi:hypothetical protein